MFKLDSKLEESSVFIKDLRLCQARLNFDGDVDWIVLVPKKEGMKDWSDLDLDDQYQLTREIDMVCKALKAEVAPDKINVASLGNIVPQLHVHVIARYRNDRAWPGAIFGTSPAKEFSGERAKFWDKKLSL